jgi:acyl-CoA dehydrogenase
LHAQRLQYGSESYWDDVIGTHAIEKWGNVAAGVIGIFDALDEAATAAA